MWNNEYKKFGKNQFHYDSNGNMVDNQAVPANTLIRTRKHGGTIKYNRL